LAHELGHWFMRHDFAWREVDVTIDQPPEPPTQFDTANEGEADEFAGELLAPLFLLKEAFKRNSDVKALADVFDLSEQAMWVRLLRHRLI